MNDLREWFEGRSVDERMAECYWKRVLLFLSVGAVVMILCWPLEVKSEPIYQATADDAIVTLHKEKCALQEVTNLKQRATWLERGRTFEGCWGPTQYGLVILYFSGDKTVALIPMQSFKAVTGA